MADNSWFEGSNSPGAGDLGQMRALQSNLSSVAEAARTARTDLNGMKNHVSDAIWRAEAAEEFKSSIDSDFLGQLDQLDKSYQDAADGFSSYLTAVSDLKDRAGTLANRIYAAQSSYESAAASLQGWLSAHPDTGSYVSGTATAPAYGEGSPYTVAFHAAPAKDGSAASTDDGGQAAHATLQGNVDDAWGALQSLYRQMHELKTHDRVAADNAVIGKLEQAHDAGIKNESGWHKFWHALSIAGVIVGVAVLVIAVVAVAVAFPVVDGGILAAVMAAGTAGSEATVVGGLSLGTVVTAGGALGSGLSLAGNIGEGGSVWTDLGDAVGIVPGVGMLARPIARLGGPAASLVSGISRTVVDGKLASGSFLENIGSRIVPDAAIYNDFAIEHIKIGSALDNAQKLINKLGGLGGLALVGYGFPVVNSKLGLALFLHTKEKQAVNGVDTVHPGASEIPKDMVKGLLNGPSAGQTQAQIADLQQQNPAAAARAHAIAANLASGKSDTAATPLFRYPEPAPAP